MFIVYITRAACAIPDGDSVVIVGGKEVSRYNESGFVEALPSLNIGGRFQSCAGYVNNQNKMVKSTICMIKYVNIYFRSTL